MDGIGRGRERGGYRAMGRWRGDRADRNRDRGAM